MYHEGLFNVLLVSSTWLTVVMAVGRYVAVCRPLHARGFISVRGTRVAIASVFVGSVLFNLPRFWHYRALAMPCGNLLPPPDRPPNADACSSCRYYIKNTGPLYDNPTFVAVYGLACSAVAILLPLPVLTVCNVCLARALRRSRLLQKQYRATMLRCRPVRSSAAANEMTSTSRAGTGNCYRPSSVHRSRRHHVGTGQTSSHHRITPTVIGLIVLFTASSRATWSLQVLLCVIFARRRARKQNDTLAEDDDVDYDQERATDYHEYPSVELRKLVYKSSRDSTCSICHSQPPPRTKW